MADLPSDLRTLVERYGAHVLDDADGLRATLNDFLDEDSSPGEVNLLVDAVRFGSLERLKALLGQGAEPSAALTDVAEGLAQRRGGDAESAYWACAVLGYAADLLPADVIPGTWERPSSLLPPPVADGTTPAEGTDVTYVVGQTGAAPLSDPNVTRHPGGEPAPPDLTSEAQAPDEGDPSDAGLTSPVPDSTGPTGPTRTGPDPAGPGRTRSRGKLIGVAAIVALIIGGAVAFALTRSNSDGNTAMHDGGHGVPIQTVTVDDTFGHFGTPAVMNKILESPCTNAAPENADFQEYKCTFKEHPTFFVDFNNGDPATKNADGLPSFITHPGPKKIVTIQPLPPSFHAYVMTYVKAGADGIRDTGDDVVSLVLYDVDVKHPGSAEFKSTQGTSEPLTRDMANELLQSIGVDQSKFPLPEPFVGSTNPSTGTSPLKLFAERSLTSEELGFCAEGFLALSGEAEHVTCFQAEDPKASDVTVAFGLQRSGLRAAQQRYERQPVWSWSDKTGSRGKIAPSSSLSGKAQLFWYEDTGGDATWGLLSARSKDTSLGDLRKMFEGFANHPKINEAG